MLRARPGPFCRRLPGHKAPNPVSQVANSHSGNYLSLALSSLALGFTRVYTPHQGTNNYTICRQRDTLSLRSCLRMVAVPHCHFVLTNPTTLYPAFLFPLLLDCPPPCSLPPHILSSNFYHTLATWANQPRIVFRSEEPASGTSLPPSNFLSHYLFLLSFISRQY